VVAAESDAAGGIDRFATDAGPSPVDATRADTAPDGFSA
jgi:hypothetical protein